MFNKWKRLTCVGVQSGFRQEVDDAVDAGLIHIHLPVANYEEPSGA